MLVNSGYVLVNTSCTVKVSIGLNTAKVNRCCTFVCKSCTLKVSSGYTLKESNGCTVKL